MGEYQVGTGMQVTLHFALMLESGEVIDSTFDGSPATFTVGDGSLLPGFEEALFGMTKGQEDLLNITPEKGFGLPNPLNVQEIDRRQFDQALELEPGMVMSFADASNSELPGVIKFVGDDMVTVDFNHPLSGQTLQFQVQILEVLPATVN